jgi:hypothetical protein
MSKPIPIIGLVCQLAFFVAFGFAIVDYHEYTHQWQPWEDPDPRLIYPVINTKLLNMAILLVGGLLGAILSWIALRDFREVPKWFLSVTRILSFLWLALFPVGIVVGIIMNRSLRSSDGPCRAI